MSIYKNSPVKQIQTSSGNLYIGHVPSEETLAKYGPFDIIWNLTSEWCELIDMEKKYSREVLNAGIEDYSYPKDNESFMFQLKEVVKSLKSGNKVFVHCFGGRGRTGMALACIKMLMDNVSSKDALQFAKIECNGPEDETQVKYVNNFMKK